MSHIPYYGEDEEVEDKIFTNFFGPWRNHWGYEMELCTVDDVHILKTRTPRQTVEYTYHFTEESLERKINLNDQDRIY